MYCPHCKGNYLRDSEIQEEVRCDVWSCVYCGQVVYGPSKLLLEPKFTEVSLTVNR